MLALIKEKALLACITLCVTILYSASSAQSAVHPGGASGVSADTILTLASFVELQEGLKADIDGINQKLKQSQTDLQSATLKRELDILKTEQQATSRNFRDIAAGVDISVLRDEEEPAFNLQTEMQALIKPAFQEIKEMTLQARKKSELREKLASAQLRLPVISKALENIQLIQQETENDALNQALASTELSWQKQQSFLTSEARAAQHQLDKLSSEKVSFATSSQTYLKRFFRKRGLYLAQALVVILLILIVSRLTYSSMHRFIPGFRASHRGFRVRVAELAHRVVTMVSIVIGPMIVFYFAEDWVLFSLGILVLFSLAWTLRHALPRYWQQIYLYLNIGSVREGERILVEGLPWRVEAINFHSRLVNPVADLSMRIPIDELVDLKSRACDTSEPWFPCKQGDWVILSDGQRGRVTGISPEMVQLIERGGARRTYLTGDFLANSPRNLAANFRIKETLGISYSLQAQSTEHIPSVLHAFVLRRIQEEGYGEDLLNLRVEFEYANTSSLDIVVITDFKGHLGDLYNRLRRAIQRWCVEACTENGWEIPFQQITLHTDLVAKGSAQESAD